MTDKIYTTLQRFHPRNLSFGPNVKKLQQMKADGISDLQSLLDFQKDYQDISLSGPQYSNI